MTGVHRLALLITLVAGNAVAAPPELAYRVVEGQNLNAFVRDNKVAAHVLLRNGVDPRILVAFPAGNSGVGLWFERTAKPITWRLEGDIRAVTVQDTKGRTLYGIKAVLTINTARLTTKQAVLSNVRFLRDYQAVSKFPAEIATAAAITTDSLSYARDRVDGAPGYKLIVRVLEGQTDGRTFVSGPGGRIKIEVTAASGDPPLTPLTLPELLNAKAAADPIARNTLQFLSYREKFLAGSWRFNTYFGRDTLMSVRMLMPVLQPAAVEAGLNSVLARLNDGGEVSHEEGLSEFAIIERKNRGLSGGDIAINDYAMVDDDFMLAPVMAHYLLNHAKRDAAQRYLASSVPSEVRAQTRDAIGPSLVRNLRYVVAQARPFFNKPVPTNLIEIKKGKMQGQWRDSDEGIGRGRYAYDVNAVFVPAALQSIQQLVASGLLDPHLSVDDKTALIDVGKLAKLWHATVPPMFETTVPAITAVPSVAAYARDLGVPDAAALAALGTSPLTFYAIALDGDGKRVPIIHSDEGFALLFSDLSPSDVERIIAAMMKPFPAGLMTDIGILTANPALVGQDAQKHFTPTAYHGVVVWSWQQALMAAGFERQLARRDLPSATRTKLIGAQTDLWRVINATRTFQSSELWSWVFKEGRYQAVAFGAGKADVDESNAAQLWSTVYLAVKPPKAAKLRRKTQ